MFYDICNYVSNKYHDELNALSPCIRQATHFKRSLEEIPVSVSPNERIQGRYGYLQPEPQFFEALKAFDDEIEFEQKEKREHFFNHLKNEVSYTLGHTLIDYGKILNNGLVYYINKIDDNLKKYPENEYLLSMKISLEAAVFYGKKLQKAVENAAKNEKAPEKKAKLDKAAEALLTVPYLPAKDLLQAVQCLWIIHSLIPIAEKSWASISVGRVDQYLYPFYKKFIEQGNEREEAKEIFKDLFSLLDSYGDGACNLNIGGSDENGKDQINELSLLIIEAEKESLLRAPIIAVRVTENMPEAVLDSLIDKQLFSIGQPTFYNEEACKRAVATRNISSREFATNSCMGLIAYGKELSDMWGIKFNCHLPLELAINNGEPLNFRLDVPLLTETEKIEDFDQLLKKYGEYFTEMLANCTEMYQNIANFCGKYAPDPFLSVFIEGAIENRCDRAVGATYNTVTIEMMGLINTCDAIEAIRELVFTEKRFTLNDFIEGAKRNFEGYDELLTAVENCKKYGMNEPEVNSLMKKLTEIAASAAKKQRGKYIYLPSLHTIDASISYGRALYTTLDGRMKGTPVNKNLNPSLLLKKREPTSIILSATSFDQSEFSGGQPIDLYFDKAWFETKEMRDKIKSQILTYFRLGGLQLQVNCIDVELLEKAHENPREYPHVIVRKGGYSVRFSQMTEATRREFILLAKRQEKML